MENNRAFYEGRIKPFVPPDDVDSSLADRRALVRKRVTFRPCPPSRSPILTGRRFGSYEVQASIGVGGMGEVYRARDTTLGRDVAIKILPGHVQQRSRTPAPGSSAKRGCWRR